MDNYFLRNGLRLLAESLELSLDLALWKVDMKHLGSFYGT